MTAKSGLSDALAAREREVRREYGETRKAEWDALNDWADALSDKELRHLAKLRIPGDAGLAVEGATGRRRCQANEC